MDPIFWTGGQVESSALGCDSSGCLGQVPQARMYLIGCALIKGLVRTLAVVEVKPKADPTARLGHGLLRLQIDLLGVQTAPKTLDKDVIEPSTPAVHADPDAGLLEPARKEFARKLSSLIRVEALRCPIRSQGLLQSQQAKLGIGATRDFPGEHLSTDPVHDHHHVQSAFGHGNVTDIGCPALVRTLHDPVPEQVRIDPMPWPRGWLLPRFGYTVRSPIWRIKRSNPLAVDSHSFSVQLVLDSAACPADAGRAATQKRALHMDLVDPPCQRQIRLRGPLRPVVDRGPVDLEQFALLLHRQPMRPVDHASHAP